MQRPSEGVPPLLRWNLKPGIGLARLAPLQIGVTALTLMLMWRPGITMIAMLVAPVMKMTRATMIVLCLSTFFDGCCLSSNTSGGDASIERDFHVLHQLQALQLSERALDSM